MGGSGANKGLVCRSKACSSARVLSLGVMRVECRSVSVSVSNIQSFPSFAPAARSCNSDSNDLSTPSTDLVLQHCHSKVNKLLLYRLQWSSVSPSQIPITKSHHHHTVARSAHKTLSSVSFRQRFKSLFNRPHVLQVSSVLIILNNLALTS